MIIPMKKITLLCLAQDKTLSLEQLRRLGLMQLSMDKTPDTADIARLSKTVADSERAVGFIRTAEEDGSASNPVHFSNANGGKVVNRVLELVDMRTETQKTLDGLIRDREALLPWGEFSGESITALEAKGVYVTLCAASPAQYSARKFPDNVTVEVIQTTKNAVYFVIVSPEKNDTPDPDAVKLPAKSLSETQTEIKNQHARLGFINAELVAFKNALPQVLAFQRRTANSLEFAQARDGMAKQGEIAWIHGFVPETDMDRLRKAALDYGWALKIEDPDADDLVPTYIRKPAFLKIMDPLFDFIGVQPGYRENDVNAFFLIFFPIFFGMILGDAGYGVLFLATALICKHLFRGNPNAKLPINLFILLSCASLTYGWLCGSWVGIPKDILPEWMRGWAFLSDPAHSETAQKLARSLNLITPEMTAKQIATVNSGLSSKFIQFFCFLLAALHLGSARLFKFFDDLPHGWIAAGHIGWGCLIVANFLMAVNLIVFPGTFPKTVGFTLYGLGILLVIITTRGVSFLNLPFSLINSFVDVLSYIRLFAVGLSGAYIAENFNKMGIMLMNTLPGYWIVLGFVLLVIVALLGHILNIALGFLGVMVHGIRLNTLEFSNHVEMQWGGIKFHPFSNPENSKTNNIHS